MATTEAVWFEAEHCVPHFNEWWSVRNADSAYRCTETEARELAKKVQENLGHKTRVVRVVQTREVLT